jgi:hypothetical protein
VLTPGPVLSLALFPPTEQSVLVFAVQFLLEEHDFLELININLSPATTK